MQIFYFNKNLLNNLVYRNISCIFAKVIEFNKILVV